jgi:hypothetical protein
MAALLKLLSLQIIAPQRANVMASIKLLAEKHIKLPAPLFGIVDGFRGQSQQTRIISDHSGISLFHLYQ